MLVNVVGLIICFVQINVFQGLIITRVARFLDCSGFIFYLFILLYDIPYAVISQHLEGWC